VRKALRLVAPALIAAAVVAAIEWPTRRAIAAASLRFPSPGQIHARIFSRDVWANDMIVRSCIEDGKALVHFTGGSPNRDLELRILHEELKAAGVRPCMAPFEGGLRPAELHAYLPTLLALRPKVLVLHVGITTFEPYVGDAPSRLAYFQAERVLPFLSFKEAWTMRGLLVRSWAAHFFAAFRYRHIARVFCWPSRYPYPGSATDFGPSGSSDFELGRGRQVMLFDAFLARWRETGIPLVVWDSPRDHSGLLPGPRPSSADELRYLQIVRSASRRHGATFVGSDRLPKFRAEDFLTSTHLKREAFARLTNGLLPYVFGALAQNPPPASSAP